jgi:P-type conjugative transfer protein TrbJ
MRRATITITAAFGFLLAVTAQAQIPVTDYANTYQNTTTALNSVKSVAQGAQQLATQVNQYQTQLNQYANEIKQATGLAQAAQIYQQFQQTQQQLQSLYGQFANGGNLQQYLSQFQSVGYWSQVPPGNYSQAANTSWNQNSQTQKGSDDKWAQSLAQHQQLLSQDAAALERAQTNANTAEGQMQAIQASAQVNAAVAQQLLEIHALLVQQQEALQARQASQANEEAMGKALNDKIMGVGTTYTAHEGKVWIP